MFNVTGDQLKGISNICCKKSEDRWTILLKAKSSDDAQGEAVALLNIKLSDDFKSILPHCHSSFLMIIKNRE